jgi:hypothetical protein
MASTPANGSKHFENADTRHADLLERLADGLVLLDDVVTELADADAADRVMTLVAGRIGLSRTQAVRALECISDEALAALCRAAGLTANGFSAVLRMRRRRDPGGQAPSRALTTFLRMSAETARRILTELNPALRTEAD